jgi:hypothetical protein
MVSDPELGQRLLYMYRGHGITVAILDQLKNNPECISVKFLLDLRWVHQPFEK